ncbi:Uncharacterised protein [Chryseobacterium indologenes]|nr:Uncharacterised protein [Chryseobacterium indologenes]
MKLKRSNLNESLSIYIVSDFNFDYFYNIKKNITF